jgi:hypothetical protein
MASQDTQAQRVLTSVERAAVLPLLLRDDTYPELDPPHDEFSAPEHRETYSGAMHAMLHVRYARAIQAVESLTAELPSASTLWRTLGYLRAFALDNEGAVEALRKSAALSASDDDALEAESLAQLLAAGDTVDHLALEYTVTDGDQVATALSSSSQTIELPVDPRLAEEGQPPPRAVYAILDRPKTEDVDAAPSAIPMALARVALFGKQTDREARLEVTVGRWELEQVQSLLAQWLPQSLGAVAVPEILYPQRLTNELLRVELQMPRGITPERSIELQAKVLRQRILDRWLQNPMAGLGGKTPAEAVGDPQLQLPLRAVFFNLELDIEATGERVDLDELRQKLNLPVDGKIDSNGLKIDRLPLPRLRRLDFATLDDRQLTATLERAVTFDLRLVTKKAGEETIKRTELLAQLGAERVYFLLASACDDPNDALKYLAAGRAAAQASKQSTAIFDLRELEIRCSSFTAISPACKRPSLIC